MAFVFPKHKHTESTYGQMQKHWTRSLHLLRILDRENTIIYRINTRHATVSKLADGILSLPVKANTVFLVVNRSDITSAHSALKSYSPKAMLPPDDFNKAKEVHCEFYQAEFQIGFRGDVIRDFVKSNEKNINIEVGERNGLRLYFIAWGPDGDMPRLDGMQSFIKKNFGKELNMANWAPAGGLIGGAVKKLFGN